MNEHLKKIAKQKYKRFVALHRYLNERYGHSIVVRMSFFFFGFVLVIVGIVLLFIPGPGILFIVILFSITSLIFKSIAILLDKLERKVVAFYRLLKRRRK